MDQQQEMAYGESNDHVMTARTFRVWSVYLTLKNNIKQHECYASIETGILILSQRYNSFPDFLVRACPQ